jgi:plasmid maintenance system antidote protein VapI
MDNTIMKENETYRVVFDYGDPLGDYLLEWMRYMKWSEEKTSEETGIDLDTLKKIIKNEISLNEEMANALAMAMKRSFWYRLESYYKQTGRKC